MSGLWSSCICGTSSSSSDNQNDDPIIGKNFNERFANAILKSDHDACQQLIRRIKSPQNYTLVMKRRYLKPFQSFDRGSEPFTYFCQQCSPLLYAIDCQQWKIVGLLDKAGFDTNRPQTCIRWTSICSPGNSAKCATTPYKKFWSRGRYTYQSSLDYFFATVFETLSSDVLAFPAVATPTALGAYFNQLPELFSQGVDVHRLDSVIVFNQLASSFDRYLTEYNDESSKIRDIPESNNNSFVELDVVKQLIINGFSEFECMEFLSPCFNWFGVLLCLVSHPKLSIYTQDNSLPPIIKESALLLINLLAIQGSFLTASEIEDNLENLQLRKLYSRRYFDHRVEFNTRLQNLRKECISQQSHVVSLKLITRNAIRRQIGGILFREKVKSLHLPQSLSNFLQYVGIEHLKSCVFPSTLVDIASGINIYTLASDDNNQTIRNLNSESIA